MTQQSSVVMVDHLDMVATRPNPLIAEDGNGSTGFSKFCGGDFWDLNLTWYSSPPDVTACFQDSVLVWVPCGFLWLALPLYLLSLRARNGTLPCSKLTTAKIVLSIIAALVAFLNVVWYFTELQSPPKIQLVSPIILTLTLVLAAVLHYLHVKYGVVTSGVLFVFWLLLSVANVIPFYTYMLHALQQNTVEDMYTFVTFYIYCGLVWILLVLSCFAEKTPLGNFEKPPCPEVTSSFLGYLTFWWVNSLMVLGYKKTLVEDDIFDLNERDKSSRTIPRFEAAWNQELRRCNWKKCVDSADCSLIDVTDADDSRSPDDALLVEVTGVQKQKQPSLFRVLAKVYGPRLLVGHACKFIYDLLQFAGPILQGQLINFTDLSPDDKSKYMWKGFLYAVAFAVSTIVSSIFFQQLFHIGMGLGMQVRATIMAAVYKKALTVSNEARRETTVGEVVNLMSVDAERLQDVAGYLWMIWSSFLQISISLYMLYNLLGPSIFAGVGVMVLIGPVNAVLAAFMQKLEVSQMKLKDNRIKLISEVLNGIKVSSLIEAWRILKISVLKLYAWELSFQEKINVIRDAELKNLKKYQYLGAVGMFTWTMASFMVMLATLTTYVLTGNTLDAQKAFVALTLFNILQFPINLLPMVISFMVTAVVSVRRLSKFLLQGEIDDTNVQHSAFTDNAVEVKNGEFTWVSEEQSVLKNINLDIAPGSLVAVVGTVGAGKSSLISAILGEMQKVKGAVNVNGQVAYVAQQAWIQNATLKDNVLFHSEFNQKKYDEVIDVCALKADLEMLPGGDQTEIGEKGINLSGGQKQRVSVARAVYRNADIYLFDDPLSAVDAHVGKHIFNTCIGKEGLLKDKTRILVTHGVHWLPHVDQILVVNNGTISESGAYEELLAHNGAFAQFLRTYLTQAGDEEADEEFAETRKALLQRVESMEDPMVQGSPPAIPVGSVGSKGSQDSPGDTPVRRRTLSRTISETHALVKVEGQDAVEKPATAPSGGDPNRLIEDEKAEEGKVKWSVLMTYITSIGIFNTLVMAFSYMCFQAASVGANMWLTRWTDDPIFNGSTASNSSAYLNARDMYLGVYGAFGGGQAIMVLFFSLYAAASLVRASGILHNQMLSNILRSPMSFFDTTPMGRILNRFSRDIETIDNVLPDMLFQWINSFFVVISSIIVISYTSPIFLALVIPLAILYYFIQRFYVPTSRQLKRLESTSKSPIFSHFSETIAGAATIRAYGQQQMFMEHSANLVDKNLIFYFANISSNRWLNFRLDMLSGVVVFIVAIFAVTEDSSGGIVGLSISYALQACQEFNWMVRMTSSVETNIVSVERVAEYANTPSEADWYEEDTKPPSTWPQEGVLEFSNYATRYREGLDLVVQDINIQIRGGEKIGIVGRTGAGKSSLTVALFRIIESARGYIEIDGIRIENLGLHQLRSKLTILPQDPVLFSGSLRMNLDPFDLYTDTDIWLALERAHLKTYVEGLATGLEHECGEGGQNLSVGQRQLVCLARTLLRKTKLLILDEATAAVDLETDDLIQNTIRTEFASCTVLTIAHRINTIMDNDRVLVLDKGRVAEFDSPATLMQNTNSIFYSMAKESGITS